jgi:hypothetical protein
MAERTFGEGCSSEAGKQLTAKAILWGPSLAGLLLLGPAGLLLGFAASVVIAENLPDGGEQPKD